MTHELFEWVEPFRGRQSHIRNMDVIVVSSIRVRSKYELCRGGSIMISCGFCIDELRGECRPRESITHHHIVQGGGMILEGTIVRGR